MSGISISALSPASPASPRLADAGSRLDGVLRILTASGRVTPKMKQSAEAALAAVPAEESVIDAFRCGIMEGATEGEGVAVLTSERLSVFDRRGFRSVDQRFQLCLASPFSVEPGPGGTCLTLAAAGARPKTIDVLAVGRAEGLRTQLEVLRVSLEKGWWSEPSVAWPGWLGTGLTWGYLGGDPQLPATAVGLRLQLARAGVTLGDGDGSIVHVAPWSAVVFLHVVGTEEGLQRAATRGLLERFTPAWRSDDWTAFLVVGYATGEHVFFGSTGFTVAELRSRLFHLAEAMPFDHQDDEAASPAPPQSGPDPAPDEEGPQTGERAGPPSDLAAQLERLAVLHGQGVLDDSEFARAKAALLG